MRQPGRRGVQAETRGARALGIFGVIVTTSLAIGLPYRAVAQVQVVRGEIVEAIETSSLNSLTTRQFFDNLGDPSFSDQRLEAGTFTVTHIGTERCQVGQRMFGDPSNPDVQNINRCTTLPPGELDVFLSVFDGTRGFRSFRLPQETLREINDETISGSASFSLIAEFPPPPPGTRFRTALIRSLHNTSISRPAGW